MGAQAAVPDGDPGACTSMSISKDGIIFSQNDGHLVLAGRLADAAASR
jgi:hypothetical protein